MKKNIIKSALAIVAVAAVGFGSYKTYNAYSTQQPDANLLLTGNVEALSSGDGNLIAEYIAKGWKYISKCGKYLKFCKGPIGFIGAVVTCIEVYDYFATTDRDWVIIDKVPETITQNGKTTTRTIIVQQCQTVDDHDVDCQLQETRRI